MTVTKYTAVQALYRRIEIVCLTSVWQRQIMKKKIMSVHGNKTSLTKMSMSAIIKMYGVCKAKRKSNVKGRVPGYQKVSRARYVEALRAGRCRWRDERRQCKRRRGRREPREVRRRPSDVRNAGRGPWVLGSIARWNRGRRQRSSPSRIVRPVPLDSADAQAHALANRLARVCRHPPVLEAEFV